MHKGLRRRGRGGLHSFTDQVADRVLANNYSRTSSSAKPGPDRIDVGHLRPDAELPGEYADLDRAVEFLPNADELAKREFSYYVSPELAVLAYVKMHAADEVLDSTVPDEAGCAGTRLLLPGGLQEKYGAHPRTPLPEIATAKLVNRLVDRGGLTYIYRMLERPGLGAADRPRVRRGLGDLRLDDFFEAVCTRQSGADRGAGEAAARLCAPRSLLAWLVQQAPDSLDVDSGIEMYGKVVAALRSRVPDLVDGYDAETMQAKAQSYIDEGVPSELAWRSAALLDEFVLLDITQLAARANESAEDVAEVYYAVNERFSGSQILTLIGDLDRSDRWSALARGSLRDDYYGAILSVTGTVLAATDSPISGTPDARAKQRLAEWLERNETVVGRVLETTETILGLDSVTQAPLSVLLRSLRSMVRSSTWESEHNG